MSPRRSPGISALEDLIRRARLDGARAAEAFHKTGFGRRTSLEPAASSGGRPRVSVSTFEEEGVALRLVDPKGRSGFAWRSPFGATGVRELVDAAFASAGRWPGEARRSGLPGEAIPGAAAGEEAAPAFAQAGEPRITDDLRIDDREVLTAPAGTISRLLEETSDAAVRSAGQTAVVDRVSLSEARATVTLANSLGFQGSYSKTLALLSVSMAPGAPEASSSLEERSSCRLRDLDPRECAMTAALRSLPPRSPEPPPDGDFTLILAPRAAASFIATLLASRFGGGGEEAHRAGLGGSRVPERARDPRQGRAGRQAAEDTQRLRVVDDPLLPGAAGSAPFDGAGWASTRTTLLDGGGMMDFPSGGGAAVVRHSFREPPAAGFTNVYASSGEWNRVVASQANPSGAGVQGHRGVPGADRLARPALSPWMIEGPILRVELARFTAGPVWTMHVLRGEWLTGNPRDRSSHGPADGLAWEGPLPKLLGGVAGIGDDLAFFHLGMPIGAPTLALRGLVSWVVAGRRRAASAHPGSALSPAPSSSGAPRKERRRGDRRADE